MAATGKTTFRCAESMLSADSTHGPLWRADGMAASPNPSAGRRR